MKSRILWATIGILIAIALGVALFYGTFSLLQSMFGDLPVATVTTSTPTPIFSSSTLPSSSATVPASSLPSAPTMPTGVVRGSHGEPVFHAQAEELIRCYNHRWGNVYMRPLDTWRIYPNTQTPCASTTATRYSFLVEETLHSWPAIDVYCSEENTGILEISASLSEHDWSENYESIFKKQTICLLSVMLTSLSDEEISALYDILRQEAKENEYIAHSAVPVAKKVHVLDSVGCWGYTYSGMIHINIIPVDQAFLASLAAKGVTITNVAR